MLNILVDGDERRGRTLHHRHRVNIIEDDGARCTLELPADTNFSEDELAPFEVIDGQHRLWAFEAMGENQPIPDDFELPVVAFHGLDIAWQAYLFWSINVSPKRINPSHAFDLYPLLRTQDWLDRVGELTVYREARAQELTELVYAHPDSPWRNRINMLGERGAGGVSQATWVRALLSSFLSTGRGSGRHGLFQSNLENQKEPLEWTRPQQAAFIIQLWIDLVEEIRNNKTQIWIQAYQNNSQDAAIDKTSWLNQDQGVRAVLSIANDLFFAGSLQWELDSWNFSEYSENETSIEEVSQALKEIHNTKFRQRMIELSTGLIRFDWRSLDGPGVKGNRQLEVQKRSYRGSGGYAALREDVLRVIAEECDQVGVTASYLLSMGA